jgi:CRP-like cAMP-binding protein
MTNKNESALIDIRSMFDGREPEKYRSMQRIFSEGMYAVRVYYLLSGSVREFRRNHEGKDVTVRFTGPGGLLGHVAALGTGYHQTFAETLEPAQIVALRSADFEAAIREDLSLARCALKALAEESRMKSAMLLHAAFDPVQSAIAAISRQS